MRRRGFTMVELLMVVGIIGLLAAIAIPNWFRLSSRSKQAEARTNLRAIWTAEKAYFQAKDRYTDKVRDLGFQPERGNRYAYRLATGAVFDDRSTSADAPLAADTTGFQLDRFRFPGTSPNPDCGVPSAVSNSAFLITACGNIDRDGTLDAWSISSASRTSGVPSSATTCATGLNGGGEPCNDRNDVD